MPQEGIAMQVIENIMKKNLGLEMKITEARWIRERERSNKIIQFRVCTLEDKKDMEKKNKLKRKKLFIENDLSKRERKREREREREMEREGRGEGG